MKPLRVTALALVLLAGANAAARQAGDVRGAQRLGLPSVEWALDVTFPVPLTVTDSVNPDGRSRTFFALIKQEKPKQLLMLTIRLSPSLIRVDDPVRLREFALKRLKYVKGEPERSERGRAAVARFRFTPELSLWGPPPPYGPPPYVFPSRAVSAYLAHEGSAVEVMLWGASLTAGDEAVFFSILDSLKFVDTSAPATSYDFFHKARAFYLQGDFKQAAEYYERALELERHGRRLDAPTLRSLVLESSGAYGATGRAEMSKGTLAFGISQEPDYAWFHYSLARVHAGLGDLDGTLASLTKAFASKSSLGENARLPKPSDDPAFAAFRKDERFRKAVREMKP